LGYGDNADNGDETDEERVFDQCGSFLIIAYIVN
jgi:hypothetical protein